jgi:hypothetical protein
VHGAGAIEVQTALAAVPSPEDSTFGRRVRHGQGAHDVTVTQEPPGAHTRRLPDDLPPPGYAERLMSKRTVKRKLRTKKKANHGKKPNCGRG